MPTNLTESLPSEDKVTSRTRLSVKDLFKNYRTRHGDVSALGGVSLEVTEGEIMVLLGPSGCGKTTLLRCVAGLETPSSGQISIDGNSVYSSNEGIDVLTEHRKLAMVFQSYALWPHMTVEENVSYPLKTAKVNKAETKDRVRSVLSTVGLDRFIANYPSQLSGGQQQRVALARALVANQGLVLFDEPLSNLDAKVRERLRDELLSLQQKLNFTSLYVTHDRTEATALGHRIAVMEEGAIAQLGSPTEIYNQPQSPYVADFVGSANKLIGQCSSVRDGEVEIITPVGHVRGATLEGDYEVGQPVQIMFRPEHCRLVENTVGANVISGEIARSVFLGSHIEYSVAVGEEEVVVGTMDPSRIPVGTKVGVKLDASLTRVFAIDRSVK